MSYDSTTNDPLASDLMHKLKNERKIAREFQERKHKDWNDNYELYRNKVKTNRLTQRQAVNIPLMKETEKTLLARIDEPPNIDWKELGGDEQKEIFFQELWNDHYRKRDFESKDVLDKKNVLRYGLSTKKLNVVDDGVDIYILDAWDVVFDPMMDPLDIETSRFIIHQNIFRSLREILASNKYSEEGKQKLKSFLFSKEGIVQSTLNREEWMKKMERLRSMGANESDFPLFAGGDVVVNLCEHFTEIWDTKTQRFERYVITYAEEGIELGKQKLIDAIGVDFWPFEMWCEDPETNDIYPDSVADLVRTPNKILNIWFSQLVENRTLRNFQMHWYDSTAQGYTPQTYTPGPGVMLPAPGDPNKTIMPVDIQGLDETLTAVDFLIRIVERGSGATAIEKGVSEKKQITLGEVEMLVGKAMERIVGIAKFYRQSWYKTSKKWEALMQANPPRKVRLFKSGKNGNMYLKELYASDWKSKDGYEPIVRSSSEQEEETTKGIQKFQFILTQFPNNGALRRIAQKRMLELVDLSPMELKEVEEEEKKNADIALQQPEQNPEEQQLLSSIDQRLGQLA